MSTREPRHPMPPSRRRGDGGRAAPATQHRRAGCVVDDHVVRGGRGAVAELAQDYGGFLAASIRLLESDELVRCVESSAPAALQAERAGCFRPDREAGGA